MFLWAVALLIALIPAAALAEDASAPCTCIDYHAIRRRLEEDDVAIAAYRQAEAQIPSSEIFSQQGYAKIQQQVQQALDSATFDEPSPFRPGDHLPGERGPSKTDDVGCTVEVTSTISRCLQEALRVHENVHHDTCKAHQHLVTSYFDGLPLKAVVSDEIQAYGAEKSFLEAQRSQLAARCFPWEGTLTYHSENHMDQPEDSQDVDGTGAVHREVKVDQVVDARFTLKEGVTTVQLISSLDTSRDARSSGTTKCRAPGVRFVDRPYTSQSHEEAHIKGSGQSKGSINVRFNDSNGRYDISFSCASVPGTYSGNKTSSGSGGCDPGSARSTPVPIPTTPVDVDCVNDSVEGTVDPKATVIRDSKPLPLPGSSNVQWEFHRKAAPQN